MAVSFDTSELAENFLRSMMEKQNTQLIIDPKAKLCATYNNRMSDLHAQYKTLVEHPRLRTLEMVNVIERMY